MLCLISQVLAFAAATYAAIFDPQALFGPSVSEGTLIASANDSHFSDVVSPRWSSWEAPSYVAAIKPVTEADVQAIVRPILARFTRLPLGICNSAKAYP